MRLDSTVTGAGTTQRRIECQAVADSFSGECSSSSRSYGAATRRGREAMFVIVVVETVGAANVVNVRSVP